MNDFLDRVPRDIVAQVADDKEHPVCESAGHRLVMWARWQEALRNAVRSDFNAENTIYKCAEAMTEVL